MHAETDNSSIIAPQNGTPSRRDMLLGAAAIGTLAAVTPFLAQSSVLSCEQIASAIDAISEVVIPGSLATQPGVFISRVLEREWRGLKIDHVRLVLRHVARTAQSELGALSPALLGAAIEQLDRSSFSFSEAASTASQRRGSHTARLTETIDGDTAEAWKILKRALLTAYYTSEKGGAGDLAFELVPGRWEPDMPLSQAPRALSNDWLAIWFS